MGQLLTHIVQKSFGDETIDPSDPLQRRLAGECVNAILWRNTLGLEANRNITALPDGFEPVADSRGRFWMDMDSLRRAEREPLVAEAVSDKPPPVEGDTVESHTVLDPDGTVTSTEAVNGDDSYDWLMELDPDAEDLDFNALEGHGFPLPKRTSERRYQLWNGEIVVGSLTEAAEQHFAGVRARIRELCAEHLVPAAGSVTDT